jgi:isopenicillin N synthase-like dioxygenase
MSNTIPKIHYNLINQINSAEANNELKKMAQACESIGCFYLEIDDNDGELLKNSIENVRKFFELPLEKKLYCDSKLSNIGRGYHGLSYNGKSSENIMDVKESFYAGNKLTDLDYRVKNGLPNHGENIWPEESNLPTFRLNFEAHFSKVKIISIFILQKLSVYFNDKRLRIIAENECMSFLRAVNYPSSEKESPLPIFHAHTDRGFFSIISQDENEGLQIDLNNEKWIDVKPLKNTIFINVGELLSYYTSRQFKACRHRVISTNSKQSRISIIYFYDPGYFEIIKPIKNKFNNETFSPVQTGRYIYGDFIIKSKSK